MVKVIAIGDLHLKMVPGICNGWLVARYRRFIDDIVRKCVQKEAILAIVGDTFDSTDPKKEELQLFMYFMHELSKQNIPTLLVSGNHETLKRGSSILDFLEVTKFPNVVYRESYHKDGVTFHLCNHDSLSTFEPALGEGTNVLLSHFRCDYNKFVTEEISVGKFTKPFDLTIVGDIHDEFALDKVIYTNNPVNKEFDTNPVCGYVELTIGKEYLAIDRVRTKYPNLIGRKVNASEYASLEINKKDYYRVEVEGTPEELKALPAAPNNVVLIKVPVMEASLNLEEAPDQPEITFDMGLVGYMESLKYDEDQVIDMMNELRREL